MTHAVVVTRHGGPEVLEYTEHAVRSPGPGEVLVDSSIAGVNFRDIYERTGLWGNPSHPPFVAGIEGAGVVAEVGPDVNELAVGDRVTWTHVPASYAAKVVVPVYRAVPVPTNVSDELAAATILQGTTAHYLCTATYAVQPGDTVLVHAAAGGTGLILTQMAKLRGARVIGTASTAEKAELARDAGADEVVVGYDDFAGEVRRLTGGEGVAAIYDGLGRRTLEAGLECLRPRGVLAFYGAASGPPPPIDLNRLLHGSFYLTRPSGRDYISPRSELLRRAAEVFGWIGSGELSVHIGGRYPLAEAAQAQTDLESRATTGKLLLTIDR
jgi:NADPH:quinone reductase